MALVRFITARLAVAIPTVFVVATLTFGLLQLTPGNPALYILGSNATKAQIASLTRALGLDQPLLTQYWNWLTHAVQGNFGESVTASQPAIDLVIRAIPVTLSVAVLGLIFTTIAGVGLGMLAALRGGLWDGIVQGLSSLAMAVPSFWLAALLIYFLAIRERIFYATGYSSLGQSPDQWLLHVTLPAIAVAVTAMGQVAFQARAGFLETIELDFLRTLQATGMSRVRILFKHVLRNGLIPVLAFLGMTFIFMLGGVVIIEAIFSLPGLGSLMLTAVNNHDLAVVQAAVIAFCLLVVLTNLVVDLLLGGLDPRARNI
jgi:peptide/nickel transport system permease protein